MFFNFCYWCYTFVSRFQGVGRKGREYSSAFLKGMQGGRVHSHNSCFVYNGISSCSRQYYVPSQCIFVDTCSDICWTLWYFSFRWVAKREEERRKERKPSYYVNNQISIWINSLFSFQHFWSRRNRHWHFVHKSKEFFVYAPHFAIVSNIYGNQFCLSYERSHDWFLNACIPRLKKKTNLVQKGT